MVLSVNASLLTDGNNIRWTHTSFLGEKGEIIECRQIAGKNKLDFTLIYKDEKWR